MLTIKIRFPEKKDAEKLNEQICSFFQGSKAFVENDIIIGPVYTGWHQNKLNYYFHIIFADESIDRSIDIEGAELSVLNVKKLWAFVDETEVKNE